MDFGGGMGAGIAVGISCGIACGISSGEKQAIEKVRQHLIENDLRIHDSVGKEVDMNNVLSTAVACSNRSKAKPAMLIGALLLAFVVLAVVAYFVFAV
jgi:hypothetical protein